MQPKRKTQAKANAEHPSGPHDASPHGGGRRPPHIMWSASMLSICIRLQLMLWSHRILYLWVGWDQQYILFNFPVAKTTNYTNWDMRLTTGLHFWRWPKAVAFTFWPMGGNHDMNLYTRITYITHSVAPPHVLHIYLGYVWVVKIFSSSFLYLSG